MMDGVLPQDGGTETTRRMISQSTVSSSYQCYHQKNSYMRNMPLSIETGNHRQHLILQMLSMPKVQGHYHYK
jgi:hypothetical protein